MGIRLENISTIFSEIEALGKGRQIKLIAVSKRKDIDIMKEAQVSGIRIFGENRIQEAENKFSQYPFPEIEKHFIGHIQSNKVNKMLELFDYFHGLDSLKVAKKIDASESDISCLIQVNISGEQSKSGVSPLELSTFVSELQNLKKINIVGLMTIASHTENQEIIRSEFAGLRKLSDRLQSQTTANICFSELSMGMSGDYKIALEEGATMLRIGTGIFGARE